MVKTLPSNERAWVRSLVGELQSHMPGSLKTKAKNRSNIVTNLIKTLKKWSTLKKKIGCIYRYSRNTVGLALAKTLGG